MKMNQSGRVLVWYEIGTRVYPSCYAKSRQIILCFNEKRFAKSIYILPVLKAVTNY